MKTLYKLIITEKQPTNQQVKEFEQARISMLIQNRLNIVYEYMVMEDVYDMIETKNNEGLGAIPDITKFTQKHLSIFAGRYHSYYVDIDDKVWRKTKRWQTKTYGVSKLSYGIVGTFGRWDEFSKYQQSHHFDDPVSKMFEKSIGMWHEDKHGFAAVFGLYLLAYTHYYFYGYPIMYTKDQERALNPKRYIKKPNPILGWRALPWEQLPDLPLRQQKGVDVDDNFKKAIEIILKHEGGYVNHPSDPGGETKYGISKRSYPHLDIKNLTKDQAREIYYKDFWKKMRCDQMPYSVALNVFDFGVNAGSSQSAKTLQRALGVSQDGIIGKITLGKLKSSDNKQVIALFVGYRVSFYQGLSTFKVFGAGWLKRTLETLIESLNA